MRRRCLFVLLATLMFALPLRAHDLFLVLRTFFVPPETAVEIHALNGTFSKSEAAVARARMRDVSVVTTAGTTHPDTTAWRDRGDTSILSIRTGAAGTYVVGVSTLPKVLRLEAKQFNDYLATEGVPEVLVARRRDGEMDRPARERYHKHVKALLQVGTVRTDAFGAVLGYQAEIVPLGNPYTLSSGARTTLRVRALVAGAPEAHLVLQYGGRDAKGNRIEPKEVRTDAAGVAAIPLTRPGRWYVKFIHMTRLSGDAEADYESRWATLTFEMR